MQCRRGHAYWIPTSPVQAPGPQVSVSSRFGDACQVSRRVRRASTRPRRRRAQGPTSCHQAVGDKGVHAHGERPDVVGNAGSLGGFPRFCNGEFGCRDCDVVIDAALRKACAKGRGTHPVWDGCPAVGRRCYPLARPGLGAVEPEEGIVLIVLHFICRRRPPVSAAVCGLRTPLLVGRLHRYGSR